MSHIWSSDEEDNTPPSAARVSIMSMPVTTTTTSTTTPMAMAMAMPTTTSATRQHLRPNRVSLGNSHQKTSSRKRILENSSESESENDSQSDRDRDKDDDRNMSSDFLNVINLHGNSSHKSSNSSNSSNSGNHIFNRSPKKVASSCLASRKDNVVTDMKKRLELSDSDQEDSSSVDTLELTRRLQANQQGRQRPLQYPSPTNPQTSVVVVVDNMECNQKMKNDQPLGQHHRFVHSSADSLIPHRLGPQDLSISNDDDDDDDDGNDNDDDIDIDSNFMKNSLADKDGDDQSVDTVELERRLRRNLGRPALPASTSNILPSKMNDDNAMIHFQLPSQSSSSSSSDDSDNDNNNENGNDINIHNGNQDDDNNGKINNHDKESNNNCHVTKPKDHSTSNSKVMAAFNGRDLHHNHCVDEDSSYQRPIFLRADSIEDGKEEQKEEEEEGEKGNEGAFQRHHKDYNVHHDDHSPTLPRDPLLIHQGLRVPKSSPHFNISSRNFSQSHPPAALTLLEEEDIGNYSSSSFSAEENDDDDDDDNNNCFTSQTTSTPKPNSRLRKHSHKGPTTTPTLQIKQNQMSKSKQQLQPESIRRSRRIQRSSEGKSKATAIPIDEENIKISHSQTTTMHGSDNNGFIGITRPWQSSTDIVRVRDAVGGTLHTHNVSSKKPRPLRQSTISTDRFGTAQLEAHRVGLHHQRNDIIGGSGTGTAGIAFAAEAIQQYDSDVEESVQPTPFAKKQSARRSTTTNTARKTQKSTGTTKRKKATQKRKAAGARRKKRWSTGRGGGRGRGRRGGQSSSFAANSNNDTVWGSNGNSDVSGPWKVSASFTKEDPAMKHIGGAEITF